MKKIILISDTHGNHKYLRRVLEQEKDYNYIFHLGDFYEDLNNNPDLTDIATVVKVPGIFNRGYLSGLVPKTQLIEIFKWRLLLVHDVQDALRERHICDITLFGHTHNPHYEKKMGIHYINPGHLKRAHHRGSEASYIVLEIEPGEIRTIYKSLKGKIKNIITINKLTEEE